MNTSSTVMRTMIRVILSVYGAFCGFASFFLSFFFFTDEHLRKTGYGTAYTPMPLSEVILILMANLLLPMSWLMMRQVMFRKGLLINHYMQKTSRIYKGIVNAMLIVGTIMLTQFQFPIRVYVHYFSGILTFCLSWVVMDAFAKFKRERHN